MPSGFREDTDPWVQDLGAAKQIAQEIVQLIQVGYYRTRGIPITHHSEIAHQSVAQERNVSHATGPEASRKTAVARRKIGTLGTEVERLLKWLDSEEAGSL